MVFISHRACIKEHHAVYLAMQFLVDAGLVIYWCSFLPVSVFPCRVLGEKEGSSGSLPYPPFIHSLSLIVYF